MSGAHSLTPADLDRLEELARRATPGKRADCGEQGDPGVSVGVALEGKSLLRFSDGGPDVSTADALFIAACDQETILSLVAMARRAPRWIPVEERVPEDGTNILAYDAEKKITWALRAYPAVVSSGWIAGTTHWMPLPEPPEVDPAPILGRAEPAPPVLGRVEFVAERIVSAEEVDAVPGRRAHTLAGHLAEMLPKLLESLDEKRLGPHAYRIRISVEPEGKL